MKALGNLGITAYELSHYDEALSLMNQQLSIVVEIGDLAREAQALGNLGNVHVALGNTPKATQYYEKALVIAQEIGDPQTESQSPQLSSLT